MFGEWRPRRNDGDTDPAAELLRQCREQFAIPPEQVFDVCYVVQHRTADDHPLLAYRMAAERERGDHAEVAAATAERPEQVGVRLGACLDEAAVGQHDVGRDEVVGGESEAPRQVAHAAAEGQSAYTGCRHETRRRRHAERARGVVDIAPGATRVDSHRLGCRVDGRTP